MYLLEKQFADLIAESRACRCCPAMCGRTAVLSDLNGNINAGIMFVGEAPGRAGADQTRVPFSGDKSGANLERYLKSVNLTRREIFFTNAVLCNPRSESGANRRPSNGEIRNCADLLRQQFELVDPRVVVTLGAVALEALKNIEPHRLTLKSAVGVVHQWNGRLLVPLYHPSPQVLAAHRREAQQLLDYQSVPQAVNQAVRRSANHLRIPQ